MRFFLGFLTLSAADIASPIGRSPESKRDLVDDAVRHAGTLVSDAGDNFGNIAIGKAKRELVDDAVEDVEDVVADAINNLGGFTIA